MQERRVVIASLVLAIVVAGTLAGVSVLNPPQAQSKSSKIQVVSGENFWGSLISQLGGTHVQVLSIVSDPNADPHEYETSSVDAQAIATASLVVVNGAGYDDWALRLISASNNPSRTVLNVANLIGKQLGDNPHFWYSPTYVNQTVHQMYEDLVSIDSADSAYYRQQYASLNVSLGMYNIRIDEIRQQYSGTLVASTESIFQYLADATGLNLISPQEFMKAVAEGNDPSAQSIVQFYQQIVNASMPGNATVLVYNQQTVTPLTTNVRSKAGADGLQNVPVTETIQPPNLSFQDWMNAELLALEKGLHAALGR